MNGELSLKPPPYSRTKDWLVDYKAKVIRLSSKRTKTKRGCVLALFAERAEILARRWQQRGTEPWVFHHNGQPIGYYYRVWRQACQQAG